jgi:hypothetical protein
MDTKMQAGSKAPINVGLVVIVLLVAGVFAAGVMMYHGDLDKAKFEVLDSERGPQGKVAILASRSDAQGMSGDHEFVVIGDHELTESELRHAFYSSRPVFSFAGDSAFSLWWNDAGELVVRCRRDCAIEAARIQTQKRESQGVTIRYAGFSQPGQ